MKVGQIYSLDSFERLSKSMQTSGFADAYAGTVLARNLTAIDPQIFVKQYPELTFVSSGIDADNSGGYAKKIESLRRRPTGGFTTSGDTTTGKGKIGMSGEYSDLKVAEREAESDWSDSEVKEAALQNINLVSDYISSHNEIYMREIDLVGYLGLTGIGNGTGLLNYAGFTSVGATGAIGTLTAAQMYSDIADLINAQWAAVNNTAPYMANRVDMPFYVLNTLSNTILNSAASPASVLMALKGNFPTVEFRGTFRADDAGGAGVSHTVAYSNNNEVMKMRIPLPLTVGEIIKVGSFDFHMDSKYRIGGLDVLENTGGYILTGL